MRRSYHSADQYINKLIEKGYKVAICEQAEDPAQAKGVKREVVQVVTAYGYQHRMLDERNTIFMLCVYG